MTAPVNVVDGGTAAPPSLAGGPAVAPADGVKALYTLVLVAWIPFALYGASLFGYTFFIGFPLWCVAFTLLLGAGLVAREDRSPPLASGALVVATLLFALFAVWVLPDVFHPSHDRWLSMGYEGADRVVAKAIAIEARGVKAYRALALFGGFPIAALCVGLSSRRWRVRSPAAILAVASVVVVLRVAVPAFEAAIAPPLHEVVEDNRARHF